LLHEEQPAKWVEGVTLTLAALAAQPKARA
jgi:hypothetical protein